MQGLNVVYVLVESNNDENGSKSEHERFFVLTLFL